jgi:hypothetical protein
VVEYGGVTRNSGGAGGGGGGGGGFGDVGSAVMDTLSDLTGRVLALPPEMLLVLVAGVLIGGLLVFRRV